MCGYFIKVVDLTLKFMMQGCLVLFLAGFPFSFFCLPQIIWIFVGKCVLSKWKTLNKYPPR